MLNGYGKKIIPELTYYGNWKDNKLHGIGWIALNHNMKTVYRGEFNEGVKSGFGMQYSESEDFLFLGMWSENLKDGIGIEIENKRVIYEGKWLKGEKHGIGQNLKVGRK